jgi:hypothetical protein
MQQKETADGDPGSRATETDCQMAIPTEIPGDSDGDQRG